MRQAEAIKILKSKLGFSDKAIKKLIIFHDYLLKWNRRYNLISKSTEGQIWVRHIVDSAQLVKFIEKKNASISDFGSGAGFLA